MLSRDQFSEIGIVHFGERPVGMPVADELRGPRFARSREDIGPDTPLWTTQSSFDPRKVEEYRSSDGHPPVLVWRDREDHFIVDGHHRAIAARQEGRSVPAVVHTRRER